MTAFDLKSGKQLWQTAEPVAMHRRAKFAPTVVVHGNVLLYADRVLHAEEAEHGENAIDAGAADLPRPVKRLMKLTAKIMTRTAYWL